MVVLAELGNRIAGALGSAIISQSIKLGELTLVAERSEIVQVLTYLRDDPGCEFKILVDLSGVDWPQRERRFDVVYHLLSLTQNARIRVKVETDEETPVPTSIGVYPAANWFERETFDMYGITFADHPDLRRLLTDYG